MTEKEFNKSIRTNILGGYYDNNGNIAIVYLDYVESENTIVAGTLCNVGLIEIVSVEYDNNYSLDQHLELINEMLYGKGYQPM